MVMVQQGTSDLPKAVIVFLKSTSSLAFLVIGFWQPASKHDQCHRGLLVVFLHVPQAVQNNQPQCQPFSPTAIIEYLSQDKSLVGSTYSRNTRDPT